MAIGEEANVVITVFYDSGGNKKALSTNCKVELQTNGITFPFDCNGLKSGESRTYTTNVVYATAGSYSVKAAADPGNLIRERNESNNVREAILTVKDLPNIGGINFRCMGGTCPNLGYATENDPVGWGLDFKNTGPVPIVGKITINISYDGKIVSNKSGNINMIVGAYFAEGGLVPGLYYTPGIHNVRADISLNTKESDLSDNSAEFTIEAVPLPPIQSPDLTIGDVRFGWDPMNPLFVTVPYTVYNNGEVASPPTNVKVSIDGNNYASRSIGSIDAFGKIEDSFTVETSLIGGMDDPLAHIAHNMDLEVDPNNEIKEKREDNNHWGELLCYPPGKYPWCGQLPPNPLLPDITLSYVSVEQPDPGSIKINYYLKNNGPGILDSPVTIRYETDALGTIQIVRKSLVNAILGPGEQMVVSETFSNNDIPTPIFPGGYYHFWINADPENMIPETDENNNILVFGVCVTNCYSITPTPTLTPP